MPATQPSPSEPCAVSIETFLHQVGAERVLAVQDGQLICLDPESAAAQALYQQALAAFAAGAITDLRQVSGASDR